VCCLQVNWFTFVILAWETFHFTRIYAKQREKAQLCLGPNNELFAKEMLNSNSAKQIVACLAFSVTKWWQLFRSRPIKPPVFARRNKETLMHSIFDLRLGVKYKLFSILLKKQIYQQLNWFSAHLIVTIHFGHPIYWKFKPQSFHNLFFILKALITFVF